MKDYLSQYLSRRSGSSDENTKGDELTELTKPDSSAELEGSVSFVSDQSLEYSGIDEDIEWRVQAMLPQIPDNGPVPFLIAREAVEPLAGCCLSCGEPLGSDDRYRCMPCGRAANIALERAMSSSESSKHNEQ
jgi:hypothetical protein